MHKCIYEIVKILSGAWDEERCDSPAKRLCSTICRSVQGETLWYYQTRKIFQVNFFIFGFMRKESDYWPKTLIYNPYIFVAFLCYVKYQLKNPALPVEKKTIYFFSMSPPGYPSQVTILRKIRGNSQESFTGKSGENVDSFSQEYIVTNSEDPGPRNFL